MRTDDPLHPDRTSPAPTRSTFDAWLLLGGAFALYTVSSLLFSGDSILGGVALAQILCLLLPAVLFVKWRTGAIRDGLRLRSVDRGTLWRVALLVITSFGVLGLLQRLTMPIMERLFPDFAPQAGALTDILTPKSTLELAGYLLAIGLVAPLCEEFLFRGAFQGSLERKGPRHAILWSAITFSLVHLNPFNLFAIAGIGVALGYLTWRTQSLWPAVLWHVIHNSASVLALYLGGADFAIPLWLEAALAAAFVGLAWEFLHRAKPSAKPEPGPLVTCPPLIPPRFRHAGMATGLAAGLILMLGWSCVGNARLASNHLAPEFAEGDLAIYLRGPAFDERSVRVGDAVLYRTSEGGLKFSRILHKDAESVTLLGRKEEDGNDGTPDEKIPCRDLVGKIVWKIDPGDEVKRVLREIKRP